MRNGTPLKTKAEPIMRRIKARWQGNPVPLPLVGSWKLYCELPANCGPMTACSQTDPMPESGER
jgi:hypothetical protein